MLSPLTLKKSLLRTCARNCYSRGGGWGLPDRRVRPQEWQPGSRPKNLQADAVCATIPPAPTPGGPANWRNVVIKNTSRPRSSRSTGEEERSGSTGERMFPLRIHLPWGSCILRSPTQVDLSPRQKSFLLYVYNLPPYLRQRALLRLLGLKKYRPLRLLTQTLGYRPQYSRAHLGGNDLYGEEVQAGRGVEIFLRQRSNDQEML